MLCCAGHVADRSTRLSIMNYLVCTYDVPACVPVQRVAVVFFRVFVCVRMQRCDVLAPVMAVSCTRLTPTPRSGPHSLSVSEETYTRTSVYHVQVHKYKYQTIADHTLHMYDIDIALLTRARYAVNTLTTLYCTRHIRHEYYIYMIKKKHAAAAPRSQLLLLLLY